MRQLGLCLVLLMGLCGCGTGPVAGIAAKPETPALNGVWSFTLVSQVTNKTYQATGTLSTGGLAVLGSLQLTGLSCFEGPTAPYPFVLGFASMVSPAGLLYITAAAANPDGTLEGQTLNVSGTWVNGVVTGGTFTVFGGCDNADHGTLVGVPVLPAVVIN